MSKVSKVSLLAGSAIRPIDRLPAADAKLPNRPGTPDGSVLINITAINCAGSAISIEDARNITAVGVTAYNTPTAVKARKAHGLAISDVRHYP
jgi:hypothetical protein